MAILTPYQIAGGLGAALIGQQTGGVTGLPAPLIAKPIDTDLLVANTMAEATPVINQDALVAPNASSSADVTVGYPTS
jgi:hypothetical protein